VHGLVDACGNRSKEAGVDIVVKGRHCEVSDRFRDFVAEKLAKLERYDHRTLRIDVEVDAERNARVPSEAERVQLTAHSRGPVVRVEAAAEGRYAAFDLAFAKLDAKLRRIADRRRVHYGSRRPTSLADATASGAGSASAEGSSGVGTIVDGQLDGTGTAAEWTVPVAGAGTAEEPRFDSTEIDDGEDYLDSPVVVRRKTHLAKPMTLDQALYEMELVGHDFFLYVDSDTRRPSVVYRRRAFDYGVIHLELEDA
jgi:ribosomal subunit interface protein